MTKEQDTELAETEYSKAWVAFKNTSGYRRSMTEMFERGILNPYSQNILRVAFDAAYNSQSDRVAWLETANAFHKKAAEDALAEQGRLIKEVESDTVDFAHKIGIAILKHSFEVIETSFRKSVVEVGKIVMEFDKEGIDIVAHPEF